MLYVFQKGEQANELLLVSDSSFEKAAAEVDYNKETDGSWFVDENLVKTVLGHDGAKVTLNVHPAQ